MPIYVFTAEDGDTYEEFAPMTEAPPFDSVRVVDGKTYVRKPARFQTCVKPSYKFVSNSLPPNYKYHAERGGTFDEHGRPQFSSQREVDELLAAANDNDEHLAFD